MGSEPELELISLISEIMSFNDSMDLESKFISLTTQIIALKRSMELDSQPKPESELISLTTHILSLLRSMELDLQPKPLSELISLISQKISLDDETLSLVSREDSTDSDADYKSLDEEKELISQKISADSDSESLDDETLSLVSREDSTNSDSGFMSLDEEDSADWDSDYKSFDDEKELISQKISREDYTNSDSELMSLVTETLSLVPEPELISLIYQIFSVVVSMSSKWKKLISLCPQVEVRLEQGKFHVIEEEVIPWSNSGKWGCLPLNWMKFRLTGGEDATHFLCLGCNGKNHERNKKAPLEVKHTLHPKHSLQLVLFDDDRRIRECYCCDEDLLEVFYYCSACDYAMNIACVEKQPLVAIHHIKWHDHTFALFPRQDSLTCNLCALADSDSPIYMCLPCGFVVHLRCLNLPRVIRIYRHSHRISFTPSFDQGDRSCCGVCRKKIHNDYGGYCCTKDGCLYVAHSRCATQKSVWDGKELQGVPEKFDEIEPLKISDGITQHYPLLDQTQN